MSNPLSSLSDVTVVIPTYRAERYCEALIAGLRSQGIRPEQVLVIDSSSPDRTVEYFRDYGARIVVIPQSEFNHGGTRRLACELAGSSPVLIFLTQDAIPLGTESFALIANAVRSPGVGMAYGCQIPRVGAGRIERHAREFNYPPGITEQRDLSSKDTLGVKATFCSNSFAAYRREALDDVGGFPQDAFFAEDQITAAKMLLGGWQITYEGKAQATHSHGYSLVDEFKRYFDVGVFHARNSWLLKTFGRAEGEGFRFVRSELGYLLKHEPWSIPNAVSRVFIKYAGYRFGRLEAKLSPNMKALLSMSPAYWLARSKN